MKKEIKPLSQELNIYIRNYILYMGRLEKLIYSSPNKT